MALQYAGIPFDKVWIFEVLGGTLAGYDWLHLHSRDFTASTRVLSDIRRETWLVRCRCSQS